MTVIAERVMPRYLVEPSSAPSRLARAQQRMRDVRTAATEQYSRAREALSQVTPEITIFYPEKTTEQRAESETRFWTGLADKKKLLDAGDPKHKEIKTALVIGGGAIKGASSGAMLEGLRDNGILAAFDNIYTDSASTANVACALGSDKVGSDMYVRLIKNGFMHRWPHGMRLEMLMEMLQENIDPQKIRAARPNWFIGVTDDSGKKRHYEARTLSDIQLLKVIGTSAAAPWAFNRNINYEGELLTDGYLTGLSTEEALKKAPTHMAVILNETDAELADSNGKIPLREKIALPTAMWGVYSWDVIRATLNRRNNLQRTLKLLDNYPDVNVAKMTAPHLIDWQTTNVSEVEKVLTLARKKCDETLKEHGLLARV